MVSSFSCARNIQHATVEQYNGASSCALQREANTPRDTPRPSSIDRTKGHRPPSSICADSCSPVPGQVMPWVIADYQSAQLDLADKATCVSLPQYDAADGRAYTVPRRASRADDASPYSPARLECEWARSGRGWSRLSGKLFFVPKVLEVCFGASVLFLTCIRRPSQPGFVPVRIRVRFCAQRTARGAR